MTKGSPESAALHDDARVARADGSDDSRLVAAVKAWIDEKERTRTPDRRAFLARFPEIAAELEECLSGLEFVGAAVPELGSPAGNVVAEPAAEELLAGSGTLGDFRIVREIGRGGMGIVYEAWQLSLNRRVALKVLPFAATLDARTRERFRQESLAAAQLDHPQIVHIYGVGCDRGVHYFAMQYIDGQSLAQVIARLRAEADARRRSPSADASQSSIFDPQCSTACGFATERSNNPSAWYRQAARLAIQIAEALDYAHTRGVLHRDVKPANLLLDVEGNAWIADFGLARIENSAGLTVTGDMLGTLRYASPEQAQARRGLVDQRSDVYSLGATLYELLTLDPVFPADDRAALLRQIALDDPRPLRDVDHSIPVELETIVLKALEKEPADRYATAADLADDLRRYLDCQPLAARRATFVERLRKLSRRNRPLVVSLAVSLALLLAGSTIAALLYASQQRRLAHDRTKLADDELRSRREADLQLYGALIGRADALRIARTPRYRVEAFRHVHDALALDVPDKDLAQIQSLVVACLGDPSGLGEASLPAVERPAPQQVPEDFWAQHPQLAEVASMRPPAPVLAPGGELIACVRGGVRIHDRSGRCLAEKRAMGPVHCLRFSEHGGILAAGCEEGFSVWQMPMLTDLFSARGEVLRSVAVHEGRWLVATLDRENHVELWSLATHRMLWTLVAPARTKELEITPDGEYLLMVDGDTVLQACPLATTPEKRVLFGHHQAVTAIDFSPDGRVIATVSKECKLRLWDAESGRLLHTCRAHDVELQDTAFSPDGRWVASGDWSGVIRLWDAASGTLVETVSMREVVRQAWRLRFGAGGRYLAVAGGAGVVVWRIDETAGEAKMTPLAAVSHSNRLDDLAIHPLGRELVALDDRGAFLRWRLDESSELVPFDLPAGLHFPMLHFDPAGNLVFVTHDRSVGRWDWSGSSMIGRSRERFTGASLVRLALSPDGRRVAVVDPAKQIAIYDLVDDRLLVRLPPESSEIWALQWSPDGTRLAAGLSGSSVVIWNLAEVGKTLAEFGIDVRFSPSRRPAGSMSLAPADATALLDAVQRRELGHLLTDAETAFEEGRTDLVSQAADRAFASLVPCGPRGGVPDELAREFIAGFNRLAFAILKEASDPAVARIFRGALRLAERHHDRFLADPAGQLELARCRHGLGLWLLAQGETEDSERLFREALADLAPLENEPELSRAAREHAGALQYDLSRVLAATHRTREAGDALRSVCAIHDALAADGAPVGPWWRVHSRVLLARSLVAEKQFAAARDALREALDLDDTDVEAIHALAGVLVSAPEPVAGSAEEAVKWARQGVDRDPASAEAWNILGRALCSNRDWEAATEALLESRRLADGTAFVHDAYPLVLALARLGRHQEARRWLAAADTWTARFAPADADVARLRGLAVDGANATDKPRAARDDRELYDLILDADPGAAWACVARSAIHSAAGRRAEAIADLRRAAQGAQDNLPVCRQLAARFRELEQWTDAIEALERSIELSPSDVDSVNDLASLLATCPQTEFSDPLRAARLVEDAMRLHPDAKQLWSTLGVARYRAGEFDAAAQALRQSIAASRGLTFGRDGLFLAMTLADLGKPDEAGKWLASAGRWTEMPARHDKDLRRIRAEAAEVVGVDEIPVATSISVGRCVVPDAATDPANWLLVRELYPATPWAWAGLGRSCFRNGERGQATFHFRQALEQGGENDPTIRFEAGAHFALCGRWADVVAVTRRLTGPASENVDFLALRTLAFVAESRWSHAEATLERLIDLQPERSEFRRWLTAVRLAIDEAAETVEISVLSATLSPEPMVPLVAGFVRRDAQPDLFRAYPLPPNNVFSDARGLPRLLLNRWCERILRNRYR